MTTIKNIKPVTAEQIFDLLKKKFAEYVNSKLDSNLTIEYIHPLRYSTYSSGSSCF